MTDDLKPVDDDIRHDELPSVERLRECLSYDHKTGILRWEIRSSRNIAVGTIAGSSDHRGYHFVRLDRRLLLAHRIAWALYYGAWPECGIDHRNMNKGDNRIANLRLASRAHNNANGPSRSRKGLPKGCYKAKGRPGWYSNIKIDGKLKWLGKFSTAKEAAVAFEQAHRIAHGTFSRCEAR